ncbi:MAG: YdcH family protein, partial [Pseudomonadales bacterium]
MTQEQLLQWLDELRTEHRDLDDLIVMLQTQPHRDLMQIQRLKKRKLSL